MDIKEQIAKIFSFSSKELIKEMVIHAIEKQFPPEAELVKAGYYVKVLPFVMSGLIKVFTKYQDKELLLYYITPGETCIMSFAAAINDEKSQIYAVTEEKTRVLLIPVDKLKLWVKKYPELNALLYSQYNVRYHDLMDTIHLVLFNKTDQRLYSYLTEKVKLHNKRVIKISHKQIASELGTAREVISRVMKKLETEGLIKREGNSIKVLGL